MPKLTTEDFKAFEAVMSDLLDKKLEVVRADIHEHQKSVDDYVKTTKNWYEEFLFLKARYDRVSEILVRKGIATQEELNP